MMVVAALAATACGESGDKGAGEAAEGSTVRVYEALTVKDPQQSAAFLAVDDLDGDGRAEIILSTLVELTPPGPPNPLSRGALRIFSSAGGLDGPWQERVLIATTALDGEPFINTPQVLDIDGDGHKDILVQTGFLSTLGGSQSWLRGPDFSERRYFAPETTRYLTGYFWHEAAQVDLDGDGLLDLVTTSAQTQDLLGNPLNPLGRPDGSEKLRVEWHRHLGGGEFSYHVIADDLGGVFVKTHDVDADGDADILLTHYFGPPQRRPSIVWMEQLARPAAANGWAGVWATHVIDNTIGLGYHMELADLDGDGRIDLIVGSHSHQDDERLDDDNGERILPGIYRFEIPADPRLPWIKHTISQNFRVNLGGSPQSQGVPGIFSIGDLDGNGRLDLAVPGDGNDKLYAFHQRADGSFDEVIVVEGEKMIAMAVVADVDGDGRNEIVAAKHNSVDGGTELPPGFLRIYRPLRE